MIHLPKSMPRPACLVQEKAKVPGTYRTPEVIKRIKEDFKNKCYIYELKEPTTINVEHFKVIKATGSWNSIGQTYSMLAVIATT
ncbi:hypothetical protein ACFCP7_20480 [Paenibacillus elgii]